MNPKSANKKGKRFENFLETKLVTLGARLTKSSGRGLDKSDINLSNHNIKISAKNQKNLSIQEWWEEAKGDCFNEIPVLIVRNPRFAEFQESLVVMDLELFMEFLKGDVSTENSISDPKAKYAFQRARDSLREALKFLSTN